MDRIRVVSVIEIPLNGWRVRLIAHLLRIRHRLIKRFWISLHFLPIVLILDVHFPRGVSFLESAYDIVGKGLIALHGDEGIAKKIESSPRIISFDDP
jgi:hypothetical protein